MTVIIPEWMFLMLLTVLWVNIILHGIEIYYRVNITARNAECDGLEKPEKTAP